MRRLNVSIVQFLSNNEGTLLLGVDSSFLISHYIKFTEGRKRPPEATVKISKHQTSGAFFSRFSG